MNEKKFSPGAEESLRLSQEAAGELGHGYVGTEHLLLGLIREDQGAAHDVLLEAGLTDDMIVQIIKRSVGAGLPGGNPAQGLTPRARRVVEIAVEDAVRAAAPMWARSTCWRACCGRGITWPSASSALPGWTPGPSTPP